MKPPYQRLLELRKRARLSRAECGRAIGSKSDNPENTYAWYEKPDRYGDSPLPQSVVEALMPLFVGRSGITREDMWALAVDPKWPTYSVPPTQEGVSQAPAVMVGGLLPVKFRAEKGTYYDAKTAGNKDHGMSPIATAKDVGGAQFAVYVADDHAGPDMPKGTYLHCVEASAYPPASIKGKMFVVLSMLMKMPVGEVVVMRCDELVGKGNELRCVASGSVEGQVLGLILGKYTRF